MVISISPFIDNNNIKRYVFIFLVYLFFQYISGYRKCGLTTFEHMILQDKYEEGFMYRLINPMITIREDYFDKYISVVHICLIIILFLQLYDVKEVIEYINDYKFG